MSQIGFKVSAKAARLIGRENITDADGAIVELIKNAYDADAECVYLKFDMPFASVPYIIKSTDKLSAEDIIVIKKYYTFTNGQFERTVYNEDSTLELENVFFKYNTIILIDNGTGMDEETVTNSWMHIGTSNKETNYISSKGRIKTGAKGIGRFALDKLSVISKMHTATVPGDTIHWELNWNQFTDAQLLDQVTATLSTDTESFNDIVKKYAGNDYNNISKYDWTHGTAIILSPLREPWNEKQFKKINNAIQSLNPFGEVDEFSIYITNTHLPKLSYKPQLIQLTTNDYDYRISSEFNGDTTLNITLLRNEFDTKAKKVSHEYVKDTPTTLDTNAFWTREAFSVATYSRENYHNAKKISIDLTSKLDENELIALRNLGPFTFNFMFSKIQNSEHKIAKRIAPLNARKELYATFSGIKIYRDNFKVRPYGEDGAQYDWLEMGLRSQRSPAPVAHKAGKWRVLPYQAIGNVTIGRDSNPFLTDMANREGLVQNDQYFLLVKLCQYVLDEFEFDRQYYYREYSKWIQENEPKGPQHTIDKIIDERSSKHSKNENNNTARTSSDTENEEIKDAVIHLVKEKKEQDDVMKMLMAFGASGIMTNTFAHELQHIETNYGSRNQQLRACLNSIFENKPYSGDPDFDPYYVVAENEKVDNLLESWISVLMNAFNKDYSQTKTYNLVEEINNILATWTPLLHDKHIKLNPIEPNDYIDDFPIIDWYIVLNNFILNSVWFLEHNNIAENKEISIDIAINDTVELTLHNNGPTLAPQYKDTPNKIFEAGESSKILNNQTGKKGTGIGLWVTKQVIDNNEAQITVLPVSDGFSLKIVKPRRNNDE